MPEGAAVSEGEDRDEEDPHRALNINLDDINEGDMVRVCVSLLSHSACVSHSHTHSLPWQMLPTRKHREVPAPTHKEKKSKDSDKVRET